MWSNGQPWEKRMSDSPYKIFPSFFDWIEATDIELEPWQWEIVKVLDDNKDKQRRFHISRQGHTTLHKLWWKYHSELAQHLTT